MIIIIYRIVIYVFDDTLRASRGTSKNTAS